MCLEELEVKVVPCIARSTPTNRASMISLLGVEKGRIDCDSYSWVTVSKDRFILKFRYRESKVGFTTPSCFPLPPTLAISPITRLPSLGPAGWMIEGKRTEGREQQSALKWQD
jgi:hypothetical protein